MFGVCTPNSGPYIVVFEWIIVIHEVVCPCESAGPPAECMCVKQWGWVLLRPSHNREKWLPLFSLWLAHLCVYVIHHWVPSAKISSSRWRQNATKRHSKVWWSSSNTLGYSPLVSKVRTSKNAIPCMWLISCPFNSHKKWFNSRTLNTHYVKWLVVWEHFPCTFSFELAFFISLVII